ncbi:DUF1599 domain-containing protein [Bacteroidales bacterium OttesenSCG-928-C19]|nr:DUF1599 domain-containing protein [Bacteroidales bacterium OttesenSCG-928-C19]
MDKTKKQFEEIIKTCRDLFEAKFNDYGASWRIFRLPSLTDQIFIKANRIRSIQEKGVTQVGEGIVPEFIGIINYSVIALIQMELKDSTADLSIDEAMTLYDKHLNSAVELMFKKNHDYDEAWRQMRVSSIVDVILVKLKRIKQIEDNNGLVSASEGVDANYRDMINYAIFALILISENS